MAASEDELSAQNDALGPDPDEAIESEDGPKVSFTFARRHGLFIDDYVDGRAHVVCRPGLSHHALAEVRRFAGHPLRLRRVDADDFSSLLQAAYEGGSNRAMEMVEGLDEGDTDLFTVAQALPEPSDLLESDDDAPIIRLINAVLTEAVKEGASDIHIEPFENRLVVRFRVDGVLREVLQSRRAVAPLIVSRIKVMSKLDIAEKRVPQDGRISLRIAGRAVDVRVSTLPSGHGERVVMRLLDKQAGRIDLTQLGMSHDTQDGFFRSDQQAARCDSRHRPDRVGQDDNAVRRPRTDQRQQPQHHDRRGPDRVLHRRDWPDAGQHEGRHDLCPRAARNSASGPGRGDGR